VWWVMSQDLIMLGKEGRLPRMTPCG
jgi:hypothetical protein